MKRWQRIRNALTLLELMIVIAIIGLLIQMMLPAIEMAREAARRSRCANNLRQIGIGVEMHVNTHRFYPSGGWGTFWVGDPDRGTGPEQPGSWGYNILEFVEEGELRQRGQGLKGESRLAAISELCKTPIALFYCPSRRLPRAYDRGDSNRWMTLDGNLRLPIDKAARSDYAINVGDDLIPEIKGYILPTSYAETEQPGFQWFDNSGYNGISFGRSRVRSQQIEDGYSKTYLVAEKFLPITYYKNGVHKGDNESIYSGFDDDNGRTAFRPPCRDVSIYDDEKVAGTHANSFGSAHVAVWQAVLCDGSVHALSYDIDPDVHKRLANRRDGSVVSIEKP
jgi:prepilin-type N-terminal cleavage/methylation domain-containing protein